LQFVRVALGRDGLRAQVVKALHPFCRQWKAVCLSSAPRKAGVPVTKRPSPIITTSYLTHDRIAAYLAGEENYGYKGPLHLSGGRAIGLRLVLMARDPLRLGGDASRSSTSGPEGEPACCPDWLGDRDGEGSDYIDNLPVQRLNPVGHWYEVPNMFRTGFGALPREQPHCST
jgi:hypothetical protein